MQPVAAAQLQVWGVAEVCVTIMAASIPILRALVVEVHKSASGRSKQSDCYFYHYGAGRLGDVSSISSSSGSSSGGGGGGGGSFSQMSQNRPLISPLQQKQHLWSPQSPPRSRLSADELHDSEFNGPAGITKTDEVLHYPRHYRNPSFDDTDLEMQPNNFI